MYFFLDKCFIKQLLIEPSKQIRIGDIQRQIYPKILTVTHCPQSIIFKIGLLLKQRTIYNFDGIFEISFHSITYAVILVWKG